MMAIMRYVVILSLLITSLLEITGVTDNWNDSYDNGYIPKALDWSNLGIIMPMICFSVCF